MAPLHVNWQHHSYRVMVGTGGIGSGIFIALSGNHTLGREESRAGRFLDRRDYCKLHIIAHYVKTLLGPGFDAFLVGKVGDDPAGHQLMLEMAQAGLDTRYVQACPGERTMYSVCFTYPDGSGGNLTSEDSACERVAPDDIAQAEEIFAENQGRGVALAAPEVPLPARHALLSLATRYHFWRAGSFVSGEIRAALSMGMLEMLDLLAMNTDEAAALAGLSAEERPPEEIARAAVEQLSRDYPGLSLSLTAGKEGGWCWDGTSLVRQPSFPTQVVSTAGAGDAHLAGMIAGRVCGLSLAQSQQLANLVAALSVTSPHTIAPDLDRQSLYRFVTAEKIQLEAPVLKLIRD